ncbi:MAG: CRISPR system precrRNA processing endoribonuclease RAMP protein Cas6 [Lachnospiraceae bacterium]|nr:CRISPR system precrRNA processing endoribonuclease RAMP protein Cas6 [Lachnospiraceae bacterium]
MIRATDKGKRDSNHQESKMSWEGIEGKSSLTNLPEDLLNWLLAGELVHVGKNTNFGFGRYRVEEIKRA